MKIESITIEDATKLLVQVLRDPDYGSYARYGYGAYLPTLFIKYFEKNGRSDEAQKTWRNLSPVFYEAAWELCRRGILRPGIRQAGEQATDDGSSGNGYSITSFGEKWLKEFDENIFISTEPGRFAGLLEPYREKFGDGFFERGVEAIKCFSARAYLACCAMCGAASESIMLATAIKKMGDPQKLIDEYSSRNGRQKIENLLVGKVGKPIQEGFHSYTGLLKYWRDEAAHGQISNIEENEAYTALLLLLRFAIFVDDHWVELTTR